VQEQNQRQMSRPCIFCSIIAGEAQSAQVYRDSDLLVIMDKYPINKGHTLVIPLKHYDTLLHMPSAEVAKLYAAVPAIAKAVVAAVGADGFNVGQNNGIAANQIVSHVHVHIIPRFIDDSPDGKWPERRVTDIKELEKIAKEIKKKIKSE
jgi:histidine triad (HIT) family protein